ncbi:MAG TPA: hypothetical protein VML55_14550 [Planctomycetaceae bacterium]|nr:hypothetical protein [Planctomycetaceae bacterium]
MLVELPHEGLRELPADFQPDGLPEFAAQAPAPLEESVPDLPQVPAIDGPAAPDLAASAPAGDFEDDFQLPMITPAATKAAPVSEAVPPAQQASHEHEQDERYSRIAARPGSWFKGFCPVVLRDDRELADADPAFTSTYASHVFQFSSAEAQATFDAHPEKYAPVLGGQDVVRAAGGEHVAGSIEHAVWFKDRLYLFSSRDSLRRFVTEPAWFTRDE